MRAALRTGLGFGLTSGIITTLGLMVGLYSGTGSRLAVVGGVLTIAVADGLSDALGIHISEESDPSRSNRHVWQATATTFAAKFLMAASFLLPLLLLPLRVAILVSIVWGMLVLAGLSWQMARERGERIAAVIGEHVGIALLVIVLTHLIGQGIAKVFPEA